MRPLMRFTPPRRARRLMAGLVIPEEGRQGMHVSIQCLLVSISHSSKAFYLVRAAGRQWVTSYAQQVCS